MRAQSPQTRIRTMRTLLRHARTALELVAYPQTRAPGMTEESIRGLAATVHRLIDYELAPRRRRARRC